VCTRILLFPQQRPIEECGGQDLKKKKSGHFGMFKNNSVSSISENNLDMAESKKILEENLKIKKRKVHFKFNQGFSNAVRRPVSITEFM
jgi:hypothetical protein